MFLLQQPVADLNGVALFEAWAQYDFTAKWSAQNAGRQVLALTTISVLWANKTGHNKDKAMMR
jgi:hypothetical protein